MNKWAQIFLFVLFIGTIAVLLDSCFSWNYRTKDSISSEYGMHFAELSSDFQRLDEIDILQSFDGNLLIPSGEPGEWDEHIREIGNIVYHQTLKRYFFYYSGHQGTYTQTDVFVGMAYSDDGRQWHKFGRVMETGSEDPYVVLHNGTFYMFFEDKSESPFRKIDLAISEDGEKWKVIERGVIQPSLEGWQSQDVSSPVVVQTDAGWLMLYEGRGPGNWGKIGYATSEDLLHWDQREEPIFEGSPSYPWELYVVPDDVIYDGRQYVLTYHGCNKQSDWKSGIATSTDLLHWYRVNSFPIHPADTLMFAEFDSQVYLLAASKAGVKLYRPLRGIEMGGDGS